MTKERRLAIQMWDEVRAHIRDAKRIALLSPEFIRKLKHRFVREHELNWAQDSWFCQYVRYRDATHGTGCQRCPLSDGSRNAINGYDSGCNHNAYYKALYGKTIKIRLKACDEIIATLKGVSNDKRT